MVEVSVELVLLSLWGGDGGVLAGSTARDSK